MERKSSKKKRRGEKKKKRVGDLGKKGARKPFAKC